MDQILPKSSHIFGNKAKGQISKRLFQENKAHHISQKQTFFDLWYVHVRVRIRGYKIFVFLENLVCVVFLKHLFWDSPFYLISDSMKESCFIYV